jgi:hypothetical protein
MNKPINKHQEHFEDCILTGDISVLDFFKTEYQISLKIDGSPAIVWGTNPANGKFFVGTKSVFNKVKLKINHSHEEIDQNHTGQVADILHACFDYLPITESIYQCDFIGFGGFDTYCPNTVTYKFPEVIDHKIIIAPHTVWHTDDELKNAYVIGSAPFFNDTENVKFVQPCVDFLPINLPSIVTSDVEFLTVKEAADAKKQINALIRESEELTWDNLTDILGSRELADLYLTMIELKEDLVSMIIVTDSPSACIQDEEIVGEGFVCKNENLIFKLVNRAVFSRSNFIMQKRWS